MKAANKMESNKQTAYKLNHTLEFITTLLVDSGFVNWFISYGTLLGISRDTSCIHGDDDIDICFFGDQDVLKLFLMQHGFQVKALSSDRIVKTHETEEFSSIDFYLMREIDDNVLYDRWNHVVWKKVFVDPAYNSLINLKWEYTMFGKSQGIARTFSSYLLTPVDTISKLECRYGNWREPSIEKKAGHSVHFLE